MNENKKPKKGKKLNEGKTKTIWQNKSKGRTVIVENKPQITAFDQAKFTKEFASKARYATTTTSRVFEILNMAGIPTAFIEQISPTEFLAEDCQMVDLEVVGRRYGVGSYLKRHPNLEKSKGEIPHRFHRLMIEFFLKTTKGKLVTPRGRTLVSGLRAQWGQEDPFIPNPYDARWKLFHPKKPAWDPKADLKKTVNSDDVLKGKGAHVDLKEVERITRQVFLVLEKVWAMMGCRLIDFKIEFGITRDGRLVVADVIDNDSWRLRDQNWLELSKQAFRDGEDLSEVERKYGIVAKLIDGYRIPQQALVLWRGSDKDTFPGIDKDLLVNGSLPYGISLVEETLSGHKSTNRSTASFEKIIARFPEGGCVVDKVGMSNGLGAIHAARTSWPVMSICASQKSFPDDIWSNVRMPSHVPMMIATSDSNAILGAMNILAAKNPIAYMLRQIVIEEFDE